MASRVACDRFLRSPRSMSPTSTASRGADAMRACRRALPRRCPVSGCGSMTERPCARSLASARGADGCNAGRRLGGAERACRRGGAARCRRTAMCCRSISRTTASTGRRRCWPSPEHWPQRVIVMTLARVGSGEGPDLARLADVAHGGRAGRLCGRWRAARAATLKHCDAVGGCGRARRQCAALRCDYGRRSGEIAGR